MLALATVACERPAVAPPAPQVEPSFAHIEDPGPPGARTFGPDSRETGVEPGQGGQPAGLSCGTLASGRQRCEGYLSSRVDGTLLDVMVDVPATSGLHPLVVLLHGWAGSKGGSGDIAEKLLDDGYAVLRYSARGFGDSWGKVNLADIGVEVGAASDPASCGIAPPGDLQSMIGHVVDRPDLGLNADAVAVTGASYGGGQSWLAALQRRFSSPGDRCVRIRTIVPIVPWSDLLFSLVPNGESWASMEPPGALKFSYVNALYASGCQEPTPGALLPCENYPQYLKAWHVWLNAAEPTRFDPVFRQIVDGVAGHRSIWWQQAFWNTVVSDPIPVFQVQGFTDDLFTLDEARRMLLAIKTVNPSYPIASYFGDIGHPRAANKEAEVNYALELIRTWLRAYLNDVAGDEPVPMIHAAITRPRAPFDPADVITVARYEDLATTIFTENFRQPFLLVNPASGAPSGPSSDPVLEAGIVGAGELKPFTPPPPTPNVPDPTAATYEIRVGRMASGRSMLIAGQPLVKLRASTMSPRIQLNVRLYDVSPTGLRDLITRGTLTVESASAGPIGSRDVVIRTAGNLWSAAAGHVLRLEITSVDMPFMAPSRLPSATAISDVRLEIPGR
jgi:ABC-2 type transport system ATP-binding protein